MFARGAIEGDVEINQTHHRDRNVADVDRFGVDPQLDESMLAVLTEFDRFGRTGISKQRAAFGNPDVAAVIVAG